MFFYYLLIEFIFILTHTLLKIFHPTYMCIIHVLDAQNPCAKNTTQLFFLLSTYWIYFYTYTYTIENISSYLYVHHTCFRCTTSMCKNPNLWMNDFHMIFIIKLWGGKFVMNVQYTSSYKVWMSFWMFWSTPHQEVAMCDL